MQKKIILFLGILLAANLTFGQYYEDKEISAEPHHVQKRFETETWKTAFAVPQGQLYLSLFAPVRYGVTQTLELQSHLALWAYLVPNVYVKKNWYANRWVFASKHGVYYPTLGLKTLRDDGENSTLNEDAEVPPIVTFQNELIVSYVLNPTCNAEVPFWIATGRLGIDVSFTGERDESFNRMTFYSLYHRTASFYGDNVFYAGLQLDGGFFKKIYFNAGADVYAVDSQLMAGLEAQANVIYHHNQRLSISGGIKYIQTDNPLESESHILPVLDVCYRFGKKQLSRGLFGKTKKRK